MAQRKSPSYPEWPVDRSVYSLFCGSPPVLTSQKATGNAKGDEWAVLNVTSVARVELVHTGF